MELIKNGYFSSGELSPWVSCNDHTLEGEVTACNILFVSSYNLRLGGEDCVGQDFDPVVRPTGDLSLWVQFSHCGAPEYVSESNIGTFYARVYYSDDTSVANAINVDDLGSWFVAPPTHLVVPVDTTKSVKKVTLRVTGNRDGGWFVCGVSMEGLPGLKILEPMRPMSSDEMYWRLAALERRFDKMVQTFSIVNRPKTEKQSRY